MPVLHHFVQQWHGYVTESGTLSSIHQRGPARKCGLGVGKQIIEKKQCESKAAAVVCMAYYSTHREHVTKCCS